VIIAQLSVLGETSPPRLEAAWCLVEAPSCSHRSGNPPRARWTRSRFATSSGERSRPRLRTGWVKLARLSR